VPTDVVRWHSLRVNAAESMSREELQSMLAERLRSLAAEASDQPLLVRCAVHTEGRLASRLRQEGLDQEVLRWLRRQLMKSSPPVWPVALEAPFESDLPEDWQEEDTILGDYLRAVVEHRTNGRQAMDIHAMLDSPQASNELKDLLTVSGDEIRDHILQQAARVGADLLRGDHV
jgi:hypothetical protein